MSDVLSGRRGDTPTKGMNKYQRHSRANLSRNLRDNMRAVMKVDTRDAIPATSDDDDKIDGESLMHDEFDDDHKESLELLNERISSSFKIARQMYEILYASNLSKEGRESAMQFLRVLVQRFDVKIGARQ